MAAALPYVLAPMLLIGWALDAAAAGKPYPVGALEVNANCGELKLQEPVRTTDLSFFKKPDWLSELSFRVEECYDSNIYLSGVDRKDLPTVFSVPQGSAVASKNRSSFVTAVVPRIGIDLVPVLAAGETLQAFSLLYAPGVAIYHSENDESHIAHRFLTEIKGRGDSAAFGLDGALSLVDGDRKAPTYPGALENAASPTAPRERRSQLNSQAILFFQYDHGALFARPTSSLLFYNMGTKLLDVQGYQNYVDRYDVYGGVDFGYRVRSQLALTLGYRYGHQFQEKLSFSALDSSNNYQRVLAGIEGKPWEWLEVKLQIGPDFRRFESDAPVDDRSLVTYYGEGSLTATPTPRDRVSVLYKRWLWTSQLGQIPYVDSRFELRYQRQLTDKLSLELGAVAHRYDYTLGNAPSSKRDDLEYVAFGGASYSFNANSSATLTYTFDGGRNILGGVDNASTREFERHIINLRVRVAF